MQEPQPLLLKGALQRALPAEPAPPDATAPAAPSRPAVAPATASFRQLGEQSLPIDVPNAVSGHGHNLWAGRGRVASPEPWAGHSTDRTSDGHLR